MDWPTFIIAMAVIVAGMAAFAVFRAVTCSAGWKAWLCYQIVRVHNFIFTHCRQKNNCPYPEHGPAIIVANHTSPLDASLLWYRHFAEFQKPRLRVIGFMMAKEYYAQRGLVGWICRAMESIPVERSGRDMAPTVAALRRLQQGHLLGIFPEGGLNAKSPNEQLLPAGTGVAWLAIRSRAPVIPVFIGNAPRSKSMVRVFFVPTRATLTYGQPVDLTQWYHDKPSHTDLIEATDRIMQELAALGGLKASPSREVRPVPTSATS